MREDIIYTYIPAYIFYILYTHVHVCIYRERIDRIYKEL